MVKKVEHCKSSQCPTACALDIIGDHWTLLVIRELMFKGKHQFKEILTMPEGISSNILSERLKKLEDNCIVRSFYRSDNKRDKIYYLTEKGKGLIYVMIEIARWGAFNLEDRAHVPDDRRAFLDNPPKQVAKTIFKRLDDWVKDNLTETA